MRPEILQSLSQLVVAIGLILAAVGGYGHFYFGKKVEQKKEIVAFEKLDSIPKVLESSGKKNTEKVLDAIKDVKESVDEINYSDGSNVNEITYPGKGEFGINILDRNSRQFSSGKYSMHAILPKGQKLVVKISGTGWGFNVFQPIGGWLDYDVIIDNRKTTRKFKSMRYGIIDFDFRLLEEHGGFEITVFENNSDKPKWNKKINW